MLPPAIRSESDAIRLVLPLVTGQPQGSGGTPPFVTGSDKGQRRPGDMPAAIVPVAEEKGAGAMLANRPLPAASVRTMGADITCPVSICLPFSIGVLR